MSAESLIFAALGPLVGNRVYPDVAPAGVTKPYITYQQVGGAPVNYLERATTPDKSNGRFQVNVWATTRVAASALAKSAADALRMTAALQTTVLGQPVATFDAESGLRGTRQDFSFWFDS